MRPFSPFRSTLSSRRATKWGHKSIYHAGFSIHALLTESDASDLAVNRNWTKFRSTLSSRRATSGLRISLPSLAFRSTLSSRRATVSFTIPSPYKVISIHALLTESDCSHLDFVKNGATFRSTLSSRRATPILVLATFILSYFDPRSPHGERLYAKEKDRSGYAFRSTLSSRRATFSSDDLDFDFNISIHALLTESD